VHFSGDRLAEVSNQAVDRRGRTVETAGGLEDKGNTVGVKGQARRRRRWPKVLVGLALVLVAAALWLNGPGIRWLGPKVAAHFISKAGLHGGLALEGSVVGGLVIRDVRLAGDGVLGKLTVKRATPLYRIGDLLGGRFGGLVVEDLHADLRLDATTGAKQETTRAGGSFDLGDLSATIAKFREIFLPLELRLEGISVNASKEGRPFLTIAPSRFGHRPGEPGLRIALGAITDATDRVWPQQDSLLKWGLEEVTLDRLDPLPGVSVRDLVFRLPQAGEPSAETSLRLDDSVLFIEASPGFGSLNIDLREGSLRVSELLKRFGVEIPAEATITSLALNADQVLPDPLAATGDLRILLENVTAEGWSVPELSLDLGLDAAGARLAASGNALDTGFSLTAEAAVGRDGFKLGETRGTLGVTDVSRLVAALADKVKAIDPEKPLPPSMLDGSFSLGLDNNQPSSASCDLVLKPADPKQVAPLMVKAGWNRDQPIRAEVITEGLNLNARHDLQKPGYQGEAAFDDFQYERIARWLETFRVAPGAGVRLKGEWKGSGDLTNATHRGVLDLGGLTLSRPDMPPLHATGGVDYDWPRTVSTRELVLESNGQTIAADLKLADRWLELGGLRWMDKGREMAGGTARLPVPADFANWRELLTDDALPLAVNIESQTLPLASLRDWLPAAASLDAKSTGRLSLKVAGTFAKPVVDARVELKELRSPAQPELPPADVAVSLIGRDGRLAVEGQALAPDFAPAVLTASMPFRPACWAEKPETLGDEAISARVDLPRVDISRFGSLVAAAEKISGIVTGNVEVAGTPGHPAIKGRVDLANAGIEMKDKSLPPVTTMSLGVDLNPERITLRDFKASLSSGTLQGGGFVEIRDGKPAALDFRLTGRHLPVRRDESLIVRANADLRLAGTWEAAALTGSADVVDSLFYRDIELLPIGSPFTAPSAAALPQLDAASGPAGAAMPMPFRDWKLDVRARTANPFLIRGNLATGKVVADLRVGGTLGNPLPDGDVKISDFRAALPFSTLQVKSGNVRFDPAGGFDPVLEIRGTAEPRPYRVNAYIYGKASNPQLLLTSSPPLPENEIMTLLATGTTTTGLEDPQAASSRAMQLLAEEMRRGRFAVGRQLRPLLALADRVDFSVGAADPYTSEKYSTATLAMTDRWFLSAGMGEEGGTRAFAIWRLTFR
jgi:hypothetical protein